MILNFKTILSDKLYSTPKIMFDQVIEESKHMSANEGYNHIWDKLFSLECIYVIMNPMDDVTDDNLESQVIPVVGQIGGKKSFMVFTDPKHVQDFAKKYQLVNNKNEILTLILNPKQDLEWFSKLNNSGVYFTIFNHGDFNWVIESEKLIELQDFYNIKDINSI